MNSGGSNTINRASIESDLNKHHVKYEDPLWDEEAYEAQSKKNIRISLEYINAKNEDKNFNWNFFEGKTLIFTLYGKNFNKKHIKYFLSAEGMQYLIKLYKAGARSETDIKAQLP